MESLDFSVVKSRASLKPEFGTRDVTCTTANLWIKGNNQPHWFIIAYRRRGHRPSSAPSSPRPSPAPTTRPASAHPSQPCEAAGETQTAAV
jgi:hypothetical protein